VIKNCYLAQQALLDKMMGLAARNFVSLTFYCNLISLFRFQEGLKEINGLTPDQIK